MPTKINKAGNQQPYIPAGNGDISGEYADSQGDNKHFKAFGKPVDDGGISGKPSTSETPKETEKPTEKETRWNELSKKQKKEIGMYVFNRKAKDNKALINELRYYSGTFGDLDNYTDDELIDIINKIKNLNADFTNEKEMLFFKEGGKWKQTRYPKELFNEIGIDAFTREEYELEKEKELEKNLIATKVQQKLYDDLKQNGFKGAISLKGINDKNSAEIVASIKTTISDFSFLNDSLVSFGTEKGASSLLEKEYRDFTTTEQYQKEIESYAKKLAEWNPSKTFTKEEIERNYKNVYMRENVRTTTGRFWGVCGTSKTDSKKSWVQLKNSNYGDYDETVNKTYIEKYGYPANIGASFGATTYHELGHAICNYVLGGHVLFGDYADRTTLSYIEEIQEKYNKPISSYGMTNISEYIAECVASHYVDGTNEQANEVFNVLLEKWKGVKK